MAHLVPKSATANQTISSNRANANANANYNMTFVLNAASQANSLTHVGINARFNQFQRRSEPLKSSQFDTRLF